MEIFETQTDAVLPFDQMNLSAPILKALNKKGYRMPTTIQAQAIPHFMDWKDVIAKAPTGTGKTFAFGIPIVEHVDPSSNQISALILAPTRELALQIQDELRILCQFKEGVRTVCLYGGSSIEKQIVTLKKHQQIVVATPARMMENMKRRTVRLDKVETVVLDEADRMLDMGFIKDVTHILDQMPKRKNMGMFSATISREVMDISWVYQRDPVEITVRADEENRPDIKQYRIRMNGREEKVQAIERIVLAEDYDRCLIFCNTKNMTDRLTGLLRMHGFSVECIHGDIQQKIREKALQSFRQGKIKILVATDVASRGLDIDDVDAVFNYDIPEELEYYIHRIGRTGRAKRHGVSYSLVASVTEGLRLDEIAKNTGTEMESLQFDEDGCLVPLEK